MERVLLGMSGGVDSTWAVTLLRDAGYDVEGAVLRMHAYTEVEEAKQSAEEQHVVLHEISCEDSFASCVIADFTREYRQGRTPNPCVICNQQVKLRGLLNYAKANGFDKIATGHYAGVMRQNGRYAICRAKDESKDQSYMLYRLDQECLSRLILPLADVKKENLSEEARGKGVSAANRKESMELCFVRGETYAEYLERTSGVFPAGWFVSETGKRLGRHRGICHYTVGQRKGLGISASSRLFVREIRAADNTIVLSDQALSPVASFLLRDPVFQLADPEHYSGDYEIMLRYRAKTVPCHAEREGTCIRIILGEAVRAVTPGQSAVAYTQSGVAFGGIIAGC